MFRRALTGVVTAVVLVAPGSAAVAAAPGPDLRAALEAVHEAGMPGAFAEVRDGRRVQTPTAGVIDVDSGRPVRDGLRHRVGSITKTFVATTVLQLAGERRSAWTRRSAAVCRPGWYPRLTGKLLGKRLLAEMQTTVGDGYGLGLYSVELPCGVFWGHDGGTIGHQTVSWHSADGTRQMTYAQSMVFYQTSPTEPHPIDLAAGQFFVAALCGGAQPATRSLSSFDPRPLLRG